MEIINKLKAIASTTVDAGKSQIDAVRDTKRRKALLLELGELTYRKHQGDPIDETAIDPVIAELDGMAADGERSDEATDGADTNDE